MILTDDIVTVTRIVRSIVNARNVSVATYAVVIGAVRGALSVTCAQSDGTVLDSDVVRIVRVAIASINGTRDRNRDPEPCPDAECKHVYDEQPAGSVTRSERDIDQCTACGWTSTEVEERARASKATNHG